MLLKHLRDAYVHVVLERNNKTDIKLIPNKTNSSSPYSSISNRCQLLFPMFNVYFIELEHYENLVLK